MASGVPLVSTRVGQSQDLVRHGINGWLTKAEDAEGLADDALQVFEGGAFTEEVRKNARHTAEQNSCANQLELWREFFQPLLSNPPG